MAFPPNREIYYLVSGKAHLPYLVVSLHTLRKHWGGRVRVFAWPESFDIVNTIAKDRSLGISVEYSDPLYRARRDEGRQGKNDQFIHKVELAKSFDHVDSFLYLDADTSVHGDLLPLFHVAEKFGFCATRFSSWTSQGKIVKGRVERLKDFKDIEQEHVENVLANTWPSVNGGVWASKPHSSILDTWHEWTWAARSVFIADEAVLHCLQPKYVPSNDMMVWPDGRFNCSCNPKWLPETLSEDKIVVWHYHGDQNLRPSKFGGAGVKRWLPLYLECLENNVGGIQSWIEYIENKWLDGLDNSLGNEEFPLDETGNRRTLRW